MDLGFSKLTLTAERHRFQGCAFEGTPVGYHPGSGSLLPKWTIFAFLWRRNKSHHHSAGNGLFWCIDPQCIKCGSGHRVFKNIMTDHIHGHSRTPGSHVCALPFRGINGMVCCLATFVTPFPFGTPCRFFVIVCAPVQHQRDLEV